MVYFAVLVFCSIESPLRGGKFVTRKIVSELAKVKAKKIPYLELGNIYSRRDWGYAMDYVEAMWKMMQKTPDDYVISSGITHTVKGLLTDRRNILDIILNGG